MQKTVEKGEKGSDIIEGMFEAGVHYGYSKSRRHPSVKSHVYATKNRTDIINLEHTEKMLAEAVAFMEKLASENKNVLLVGSKPEARKAVEDMASAMDMPYVTLRWIGGTLTNFSEIKKRIIELETLTKEKADGSWSKYTKKEASDLSKKMQKLDNFYGGLLSMKKLPDAIFIVDPKEEATALAEAKDSGIPVIAILNSDSDISDVAVPIVANDASVKSIKFLTETLAKAWKKSFVQKEKA